MKTFEQAIVAHEEWRAAFEREVRGGGSGMEVDAIRVDNRCLLGMWLCGDGAAAVLSEASVGMLRDVHAEFHRAAADVLATAQAGRAKQAVQALAAGSPYGQWSEMMVHALKRYDDFATLRERGQRAEPGVLTD